MQRLSGWVRARTSIKSSSKSLRSASCVSTESHPFEGVEGFVKLLNMVQICFVARGLSSGYLPRSMVIPFALPPRRRLPSAAKKPIAR